MDLNEFSGLLRSYYQKLEVYEFDLVYVFSDLRGFASAITGEVARDELFHAVLSPLLDSGATVLMPTFTYTTEGEFEVTETPTRLGAMNKWMLKQDGVRRSEHPLFSDAALGPKAELVENVGKSAFGMESVFDRLRGRGCGFLQLGLPMDVAINTAIHYVEQRCGATYRLHKAFRTKVYRRGQYVGTDYTAFLRRLDVPGHDFVTAFKKAAMLLRERGLVREAGDAGAQCSIVVYGYDESVEAMAELYYEDPHIFLPKEFIQY